MMTGQRPSGNLFSPCEISGLVVMQRSCAGDSRGFLSRIYSADLFQAAGFAKPVVQINHTLTRRIGTVRGMHFQWPPHAETKIVSCVRGQIFDVAVDLRRGSPTFLHWHGEVLSMENLRSLIIPEGFAHGFQALSSDSELIYLHTAMYEPSAEGALNAMDPILAIKWPLPIAERSDRDCAQPMLTAAFEGIRL
jgi:dTDP-4-dehydrorhamnose 3,5-epimerase